jgi:hypothetical protein
MAQETVKEVINRIVKSIRSDVNPCYNCINANSRISLGEILHPLSAGCLSAYTVRKVSEEPTTMCNGVDCCDGCRYRLMKTSSTAYDSVFPLKVSTLIK